MTDVLTKQIIEQLNHLPDNKKKALLELIKTDVPFKKDQIENFKEEWKKKLLATSVWTDSEIKEIYKARQYINTWRMKQFF